MTAAEADRRVCPADGGDHDWRARSSVRVCGRRNQSAVVATGFCPKCETERTVVSGSAGVEVTDIVRPG